ncbi:methionyl-tRNA formyltransferase [Candidatus Parcubacteria bacterium]|uniref:Methionyl-tRNA formyltransferase n=1 Tax=Candidatus Kaiserbacteria bacterium CG10_big_fil_rev_8_21_14_0_10_47_16 TaxID=1974608 RepID=A0A2H0UD75_9BACT|nr:methionyl-tRNA formyltransferase [Candidatus Parcubacteria bacterium]PIR84374.1 MAG: methionyl-tRNA formyltransferase [Candidatus Kaiserbacteria bacterium CG10_big_fil_rev_8_21_14_0_10_47_16]
MKFAFFGTPYVARDTLAILLQNDLVPKVVITNPDAPRGRGHELTPCETKVFAQEKGLPVLTPAKITPEVIDKIKSLGCDYALVVAYGKILPEALINIFPKGVLNVHYSLLPKYRGASPVESALLCGETTTGVTIQKMVHELDAGDIVATKETDILPTETTKELRPRLVTLGAQLLVETLPAFLSGEIVPVAQDHTAATHFGKIKKEEGKLDLSAPDKKNWNKYRAYAEGPGTYFFTEKDGNRIRVKITSAHLTDSDTFEILRIIPEGKKEMNYSAFTQ